MLLSMDTSNDVGQCAGSRGRWAQRAALATLAAAAAAAGLLACGTLAHRGGLAAEHRRPRALREIDFIDQGQYGTCLLHALAYHTAVSIYAKYGVLFDAQFLAHQFEAKFQTHTTGSAPTDLIDRFKSNEDLTFHNNGKGGSLAYRWNIAAEEVSFASLIQLLSSAGINQRSSWQWDGETVGVMAVCVNDAKNRCAARDFSNHAMAIKSSLHGSNLVAINSWKDEPEVDVPAKACARQDWRLLSGWSCTDSAGQRAPQPHFTFVRGWLISVTNLATLKARAGDVAANRWWIKPVALADRWHEPGAIKSTLDGRMVPELTVAKLAPEGDCWDPCHGREGLCISCPYGYACCCKACANRLFDKNALECQELSMWEQTFAVHTCVRIPNYDGGNVAVIPHPTG